MSDKFDVVSFLNEEAKGKPMQNTRSDVKNIHTTGTTRPPTREELELKITEAQQKLADLKRAQEELERARAALEEAKRRQVEFQTGRQEIIRELTRGVGILEKSELKARQEAEQLSKTLAGLKDALAKVQAIRDETWTKDNYQVELTKALTSIENARMELNSAKLKWPILTTSSSNVEANSDVSTSSIHPNTIANIKFRELCKLGLAFSWPIAAVILIVAIAFMIIYIYHK